MAKENCSKNIHIQLPILSEDIDFGHLIASDYIKTGKIVDNCGNVRIKFLPDPCVPLTGEEECDENPLVTEIAGSVEVECDLSADTIRANRFFGDGCELENTDNTKLISVEYSEEDQTIIFTQQNTKICGDEEMETEEIILPVGDFMRNTIIEEFDFGLVDDNEDLLSIIDSDNRVFTVDMSKYSNHEEQYIAPGFYEASPEGIITLPYNIETEDKVEIDISKAVDLFGSAEFDKCSGVLTLTSGMGEQTRIEGFPTNISLYGEVKLMPSFSGRMFYQIENNVMMVVCDFQVSNRDAIMGGAAIVGKLPVTLLDFQDSGNIKPEGYVRRWLVSMHGSSYNRLGRVQLFIALDGTITLRQWQMPERIQDTFTILIESVDSDLLDCNGENGGGEEGENGGGNGGTPISKIYTQDSDTIEFEGDGTEEYPLTAHFIGEFQPETAESIRDKYESLEDSLVKENQKRIEEIEETLTVHEELIEEIGKDINDLTDLVDGLSEEVKNLNETVEEHSDKIDKLTESLNEVVDMVNEHSESINDLNEVVNTHSESIKELVETVNVHSDNITDLNETVNELSENVKEISESVDELNKVVDVHSEDINDIKEFLNNLPESEIPKHKGVFSSVTELETAYPTGENGWIACVIIESTDEDNNPIEELYKAIWEDTKWVIKSGLVVGNGELPETIRDKYESLQNSLVKDNEKRIEKLEQDVEENTKDIEELKKVVETIDELKEAVETINDLKEKVDIHSESIGKLIEVVDGHSESIKNINQSLVVHHETINELGDVVNNHSEIINQLSEAVIEHSENLNKITELLNIHSENITNIAEIVNNHSDDIEELKEKVDKYSESINDLKEKVDNHSNDIAEIKNLINNLPVYKQGDRITIDSNNFIHADKQTDNNFSDALKDKLEALESPKYKGVFPSQQKLVETHPTAEVGDSADVIVVVTTPEGNVEQFHKFIWNGTQWEDKGMASSDSAEVIRQKYESLENSLAKDNKRRIDELEKVTDKEIRVFVQSRETKEIENIFNPALHDAVVIEYVVTRSGLLEMGTIRLSEKHFFVYDVMGDDVEFTFSTNLARSLVVTNNNRDNIHAKIQCKLKYFAKY